MQLPCSSLAHFSKNSHVRLGVSPTSATAIVHSHLWVCFPLSQLLLCSLLPCLSLPHPHGPRSHCDFSLTVVKHSPPYQSGCSLCFFNSVIVGVPWILIFWHFWLFIDFRLVVFLLLIVWGNEGFLPTPPSWPELSRPWDFLNFLLCIFMVSWKKQCFTSPFPIFMPFILLHILPDFTN